MLITIIIPTYNEKDNIGRLIDELEKIITSNSMHTINILVVDDNSPDGTEGIVQDRISKYKNVFITVGKKEGLGNALLRGME